MCKPSCLHSELLAKPFRGHLFPGGAHGWNIDIVARTDCGLLSTPSSEGWNGGSLEGLVFARCWVLRDRAPRWWGRNFWAFSVAGITGQAGKHRPYFENYTVDASILDSILYWIGSQRLFRTSLWGCSTNHWSISVPEFVSEP